MIAGDTIAAFSSALAPSARIILRMSGPDSVKRATDICPQLSGKPGAFQFWLQWDSLRCPAWLYVFRAPASYTGEDLIEFHLPGSVPLAKMLLDELLRHGARLAEPGEFTARGYFSGRMDLAEAEGVAATIAAGNNQQLLAARQLAGGELGRRLAPIIDSLTRTLALVELGIDFSEEDVTFMQAEEVARQARQVDQSLEQLLSETARFERLGTEPRIVLVGRPNAGKSTLINRLAGHSRAVVSDISGTTRDVLSAEVKLADGFVQLVDVAGIEERVAMPSDPISEIEYRAQEQSRRALAEADHIILLREITDERPNLMFDRNIDLLVISKSDLSKEISTDGDIAISAATGFGIDRLKELLNDLAFRQTSGSARLALNRRHIISLETARRALVDVWQQNDHPAAEVMAMQIREALDSLGEVLGKVSPDDVLGKIFSGFCIGK